MKNRRKFLKKSALAVTGLTFINSLSAKSYRKIIDLMIELESLFKV